MRVNVPNIFSLLLCSISSLMCSTACNAGVRKANLQDRISIAINMPWKPFVLGNPIPVKITISNQTGNNISFLTPRFVTFGKDTVQFYLSQPNDNFALINQPIIYIGPRPTISPPKTLPTTTLAPGKSASWEFTLTYSFPTPLRRRWLFPVNGIYKMKCSIQLVKTSLVTGDTVPFGAKTTSLMSEPISFRILRPHLMQNKKALNDLKKLHYRYLLYAPRQQTYLPLRELKKARREIQAFVKEHPNSRYTSLGRLFGIVADIEKSVNQSHLTDAEHLLGKVHRIAKKSHKPVAVVAAHSLPHLDRLVGRAKQKVRNRSPKVFRVPASKETATEIEAFLHHFADAVETRSLKKIRPLFVKGKHGQKLAHGLAEDANEPDVKSGKLGIQFKHKSVYKLKNGHYRVDTHINSVVGSKVVDKSRPLSLEIIKQEGRWRILNRL